MPDVTFTFDTEEAKAVNGFLRMVEAQKKNERQFNKTTKAAEKQDNKMSLFARGQSLAIVRLVAGWGSVETAIGAATAVLERMNRANDQAADSLKGQYEGLGRLFQVYGPENIDKALRAVRRSRTDFGMAPEEALAFQFDLSSAGFDFLGKNLRGFFGNLKGVVPDVGRLMGGVQKIAANLPEEDTGTERDIANKLEIASQKSVVDVETMGTVVSMAAKSAALIGAKDEEILAIASQITAGFPSVEQAGTSMARLADEIDKQGLGGEGYIAALDRMTDAQRTKILGKARPKAGLLAIEEARPLITGLMPAIKAQEALPVGEGALDLAVRAAFEGGTEAAMQMQALRADLKAEQLKLVEQEKRRGASELEARTALNNLIARGEATRETELQLAAREKFASTVKDMGASAEEITRVGDLAAARTGILTGDATFEEAFPESPLIPLIKSLREVFGDDEDSEESSGIKGLTEAIRANTEALNASGGGAVRNNQAE